MRSGAENWPIVKLGDVVRQVKDRVDPERSGLDRYIAGEHMDSDDLRLRRWGVVGSGYLGPAFHMRFRPGHILYGSRRTYLRKVAVADFEGICANTTFVLEPGVPRLLPEFLPLVMTTEAFHRHSVAQSKGSVNPYVNFRDLAWYEFSLPPLDVQKATVEVVQAADAVVEGSHQAIDSADRLLAAMLQELVSDCGTAPASTCADVADVQVGKKLSPDKRLGVRSKPTLRAVNLRLDGLDLSDVNEMDFVEREDEALSVREQDILLVEGGNRDTVGAPTWVATTPEPPLYIQNTIVRLRCVHDGPIAPRFLYWVWRAMFSAGHFERVAVGTKLYHLGPKRVAQQPIPVPEMRVQTAWTRRVDALQGLRERLKTQLDDARQVRTRLLERVMEVPGAVQ